MNFNVQDKHVVVAGGGRSGVAAARLLRERGARVTLSDTRSSAEVSRLGHEGITIDIGPHRPDLFTSASLVVVSPGVPPEQDAMQAARRAGIPVIGEVELAAAWLKGRIIAITGTKGKSTTTTLTARMMQEAGLDARAGGNLGNALSEQVSSSHPDTMHVVEVSSFQLETTRAFHPWISVLLNLSADHLDRHGTFEAYAAAKAKIFANQTVTDWAVINADDPAAMALAGGYRARRFDFAIDAALTDGVTIESGSIVWRKPGGTSPLLPLTAVHLPGRHLLGDVLAAAAVGCVAGVPPAAMRRAVENFHGLPHALERVAEVDGVAFVNDSKATNIAAARRAFESFPGGVVAIMGGRYKGGDFTELAGAARAHVAAIVAIGEATPLIESALGSTVPVYRAVSMADAVAQAFANAPRPGVVLLAPACASFDMFRDYADRGDKFKEAVAAIGRSSEASRANGAGRRGPRE